MSWSLRFVEVFLGGTVVYSTLQAQVLAGGRGKGHFSNGLQSGVHLIDSWVSI